MLSPRFHIIDAIALLVITTASAIGINQYAYGVYNHCITIPFIKNLLNPELYQYDYLVAERKYFYTFFLPFCSFILSTFKTSLPVTFFALYFISLYASFHAIFILALKLFSRKEVAYIAVMLLVFSLNTIGMERTIENTFMERTFALPLLLYSFYAFFSRHYNTSAVLAGVAFLFHPLSASYVLAMLITCMLYKAFSEKYGWQLLAGIGLLLLVISPALILKFQNPAPGLNLFHAGQEWLELLRLRSAHHIFPSEWSGLNISQAFAFVAGFLLTWKYKPAIEYHRVVIISFFTMLAMFVVGTVFTELIPVSIVIQFQLFRSFKFLVFFAIIYFANYLFSEPNTATGITRKLMVALLIAAPYLNESGSVIVGFTLLLLTALLGSGILEKISFNRYRYLLPGQIALLVLLGIYGSMNKVPFSINNGQDKSWLAAQQWAKENTPVDAIFIVPPYLEGFRVESERTLYGEWKDGTQMFFNPEFGTEWMRRMKNVGYIPGEKLQDTYTELTNMEFEQLADELADKFSGIFIVTPHGKSLPEYEEVYSNIRFNIYRMNSVSPTEVAQTGTL